MPIFGKKKNLPEISPSHSTSNLSNSDRTENQENSNMNKMGVVKQQQSSTKNGSVPAPPHIPSETTRRPKYNFHCQLAHGSPTGIISGFTNVKELYAKISECYSMSPEEILYCTLNTHKVDMEKLLGGQIGLEDFIFAHVKGQKKEIEVMKNEDALGLTITDNGAGYAFIKRIRPGSIMDKISMIEVGDHIEKIDGVSFVNKRHFDVAKRLKEITRGCTFTIRLISPEKSAYSILNPRSAAKGTGAGLSNGKKTLRLRAKGDITEEEAPNVIEDGAIMAINKLIESLLGIDDKEMAQTIWELGKDIDNPHDFAVVIDQNMGDFGFPDDLVFDFWGSISDAKNGRLPQYTPSSRAAAGAVDFNEAF